MEPEIRELVEVVAPLSRAADIIRRLVIDHSLFAHTERYPNGMVAVRVDGSQRESLEAALLATRGEASDQTGAERSLAHA